MQLVVQREKRIRFEEMVLRQQDIGGAQEVHKDEVQDYRSQYGDAHAGPEVQPPMQ